MKNKLEIRLLSFAERYLNRLSPAEQAMVVADIEDMRNGNFDIVHTKKLSGPIRELIAGYHRFSYFRLRSVLYFVRGFRKKTAKTPRQEIEYARKIYTIIENTI
jgi:phage-related protein